MHARRFWEDEESGKVNKVQCLVCHRVLKSKEYRAGRHRNDCAPASDGAPASSLPASSPALSSPPVRDVEALKDELNDVSEQLAESLRNVDLEKIELLAEAVHLLLVIFRINLL